MIEAERLVLRRWRDDDAIVHHRMCGDPRMSATLGPPPSIDDSRAVVARQNGLLAEHGHCAWAMDHRETGRFIGWCGIKPGRPPIEGDTEIGWSVAADLWGRELAREAAKALLSWTWKHASVPVVAAITSVGNARSRGLMARLGLIRVVDGDFDHPDLAADDPLRPHILYRIARPAE